jgi:hypothetical protein
MRRGKTRNADAGVQLLGETTQHTCMTLFALIYFGDAKLNPIYDARNNKIKRRFAQETP